MIETLKEIGTIEKIDKVIKVGKISILASVIKSIQTRYDEPYKPLMGDRVEEKYLIIIEELDGKENIQEYENKQDTIEHYNKGVKSWEKWTKAGLFIPAEIVEGE